MRRALTALTLGALLATGITACGDPAPVANVEDCDAEDWANRESDCGFTDADRKKRSPAPRKTPAKRK